jgi:hypothetical protein
VKAESLTLNPTTERVKVKRDGPRGWHWVSAASFDPIKHTLFDDLVQPARTAAPAVDMTPTKRGPGRPRKTQGATYGNG